MVMSGSGVLVMLLVVVMSNSGVLVTQLVGGNEW